MTRADGWEDLKDGLMGPLAKTVLKSVVGLFQQSSRDQIDRFMRTLQLRRYRAGAVLCSEGETAQELYVLCSGSCGIYTQESDGRLRLIEAVDQVGMLMGEQVFRHDRKFRSATILTLGECEIGALSGQCFRELLQRDTSASETLSISAARYARNKLLALAEEISEFTHVHPTDAAKVRQHPPGTTLFSVGEKSRCAFFLLSGSVSLFRSGSNYSHETIRAGLIFGAREVMSGANRTETAVSASNIEVLEIDATVLKGYIERKGTGGTILTALESAHELPQFGTVYRSMAHVDGVPCVISDYRLLNGARVRVRLFPDRSSLEVAKQVALGDATTVVSADGKVVLLVSPSDELVGVRSPSDWKGLSSAMNLVLRSGRLSDLQRRAFVSTGELLLESSTLRTASSAEIVCACTNATCATLSQAAKRASTVEELIKLTGAGGVCGGCRGRLPMFLGKQDMYLCRLSKQPLAEGSFRVFLDSVAHERLPAAKVGQFIRIDALIDGVWIGRPYTLTSCKEGQYEIGVKIEDGGFFSNWLKQTSDGTLARVFAPEGDVCPNPADDSPLIYVVAGIGVTPAIAAARRIADLRPTTIMYGYRRENSAPYLNELRELSRSGQIRLEEYCSTHGNRLSSEIIQQQILSLGECEVIVCGPGEFNRMVLDSLSGMPRVKVRTDSFLHAQRGQGSGVTPGAWRQKDFTPKCPLDAQVQLKTDLPPVQQAIKFLQEFDAEQPGRCNLAERIELASQQIQELGTWVKTAEELGFAARVAWRNAARCVGRLYWKGLHLRDCRDVSHPDAIAQSLFEHMRFAWNGGDLRPAITVFSPGNRQRPGPRIWNPQLLRYAGLRLRSGKQIGDPAQNALTLKIMTLGWEPEGTDFDLLPLVIQTQEHGPKLYELPEDCKREVELSHPQHPWLSRRKLKWYALPAVSDMALDAGGMMYPFAPFNGWYLDCEIAARNLTDSNRYNLLPEIAESMGLDISNDRTLWRDKAMLMLHEAVLHSYDRAGVKMADHHNVCHEFLEFCRNEQADGREPFGKWMWLVPPFSSSATPLYQEPFRDIAIKPAYRYQKPVWGPT
jgi:nitric oxide synthase oxygenase domain/subunit/ferredoxin-NADP reductase/CRP-like cAMP-binding protein